MSERTWSKLGSLAATIVLLVVAFSGGFATYAAFTDSEHATVSFSTGTIQGGPPNGATAGAAAAANAACDTGGSGNVGTGNGNAGTPGKAGNGGEAGNVGTGNGGAGNSSKNPCSTGQQAVASSIGAVATPATRQ